MNSKLKMLIPEDFHPLLSCISPSAFKVVDWKSLFKTAPLLSQRVVKKSGVQKLAQAIENHIPRHIAFEFGSSEKNQIQNSDFGKTLLEIYFGQIYCENGLFLDLRPARFSQNESGSTHWNPNGLWVTWDSKFRNGMIEIYEGYYEESPSRLRDGLLKVGLVKEGFQLKQIEEVESILRAHIGGDPGAQKFEIKSFTSSFERLFQFLIKNDVTLNSDFLFLGVYLASLYTHLQTLGGTYDVREAFLEAKRLQKSEG